MNPMSPMTPTTPISPGGRVEGLARWLPLLVWLLVLLACGGQMLRSNFVADLSAFLPASPDARQRVLIEQLQGGVPARTLLLGIEGGDPVSRAAASRALALGLRQSGLFEQVQNGETEAWSAVGDWLFQHRYLLSPAVDAQRFSEAGLRQGIQETLSLLGTPAGNAIKPLLDADPTGETVRIAEGLIPSSAPRNENGVWVSREGAGRPSRALLVASSKAPGADLDAQAAAIARVQQVFEQVTAGTALQTAPKAAPQTAPQTVQQTASQTVSQTATSSATQATPPTPTPALLLRISGAPVFGVQSRAQIEAEIQWLAIAGTLLMSLLLLLTFASLPALGVALLPVATGVLVGIAAVSIGFGNVHGITLGFGATLIGEAVDYAIYYLIQSSQGGWRSWLRNGWPTVRLGLLTSVCGFGALLLSGFPGLAQLGVFSLAGLLAAALFTRFVMPVLMPNGVGVARRGLRAPMGRFARRAVALLPALRWPLLALGLAAAVLLQQRGDLWVAQLSSLSPISQEALALDESLRADLSAGDARTLVVVQGGDLQSTLRAVEAAAAKLEPLVERGQIGGFDSVARWLPSEQTQAQRRASLPEAAELQRALQLATVGGPLSAQRLAPFVDAVQQARTLPAISLASLRGTALSPLLDALLLQRSDGSWVALIPLQPPADRLVSLQPTAAPLPPEVLQQALQQALADLPQVQVIEIGSELTRLYARYLGEAQTQALLGALGVVLLMALTLRSWKRLLGVCQPLLLAVLLTMGALAAFQVQLGILHLVGLLLVVAVGSNYALFFDMLRQRGRADDDTLASLLLANLSTVLGFGLIALSSIPALSAIGRVVAPGALLALLLSAAFIPMRAAGGGAGSGADSGSGSGSAAGNSP